MLDYPMYDYHHVLTLTTQAFMIPSLVVAIDYMYLQLSIESQSI